MSDQLSKQLENIAETRGIKRNDPAFALVEIVALMLVEQKASTNNELEANITALINSANQATGIFNKKIVEIKTELQQMPHLVKIAHDNNIVETSAQKNLDKVITGGIFGLGCLLGSITTFAIIKLL